MLCTARSGRPGGVHTLVSIAADNARLVPRARAPRRAAPRRAAPRRAAPRHD